jgi:hypothetical protein
VGSRTGATRPRLIRRRLWGRAPIPVGDRRMDKPQVGKLLLVSSALFLAIGLVLLALGQPRVISLAMVGVAVGDLVAATVIRRLQ